jgi:hypothetical protein
MSKIPSLEKRYKVSCKIVREHPRGKSNDGVLTVRATRVALQRETRQEFEVILMLEKSLLKVLKILKKLKIETWFLSSRRLPSKNILLLMFLTFGKETLMSLGKNLP